MFARFRLALAYFAISMAVLSVAPARAAAAPVQPEGMPAAPGQYSSYQDWLSKQTFTKAGMPDAVVNEYVQCAYQALHDIMSALERDMLDQAARGNGMTAPQLRAFERSVADRLDDGEATEHILKTCKAPYDRFMAAKPKVDG
jgi:hypothetical protein